MSSIRLDAAEMRRRWSDKTNVEFSQNDFQEGLVYGPENFERDIDFYDCDNIVFMDGDTVAGDKMLLMTHGTGHATVPAGVQVRIGRGAIKLGRAVQGRSDASVVSSTYGSQAAGYRAPPPTRAVSYVGSSVDSGYRTAPLQRAGTFSQASGSTYRPGPSQPSPPRSAAGLARAGTHVGGLAAAQRVPLPPSRVGTASSVGDWVVDQQNEEYDFDERGSVAPGDSVSQIGISRRPTWN